MSPANDPVSVWSNTQLILMLVLVDSLIVYENLIFPLLGILKPEVSVKYIAVFIIFFNSGISLKSEVKS